MDRADKDIRQQQAREMLIAGESFVSIMNCTGLDLKDVKKVQQAEMRSRF